MVILLDVANFIITILTSSVISAIVTNLFSEWQKRNEYKRDYYKKIIDRRLKAYEVAESLASCFDERAKDEENNYVFLSCCSTTENAKATFEALKNAEKYEIWLSRECQDCIKKLNEILLPLLIFDEEYEKRLKLNRIKLSIDLCGNIEKQRDKLRNIIAKDMINLHDVDSFFNN